MRINQSFAEFQGKIDASKMKMQELDQSASDLNRDENAVETKADNGDYYQASTDSQGLHSFTTMNSVKSQSFFWNTTNSTETSYNETGRDSIVQTETTEVKKSFRWFPGISTSDSDSSVTEAKKNLPF